MFHQDIQVLKFGATPNMLDRISATYHRMPAGGLIFAYPRQVSSINVLLSFELLRAKYIKWTHRGGVRACVCVFQPHV
jgi:hypothetical protein